MAKKQKTIHHKTCPLCNSSFDTTDSRKIFCSAKCCQKAMNLRKKANLTSFCKICPICGSAFDTTDSRKIYCSYNCAYESKKARENARNKAQHKKFTLTPRPCIVCGKIFTPEKTNAKLICSVECEKERDRATHKGYHSYHRKPKPQSKLRELAQNAHNLRMQRQLEAKENGLTYGQYVALLGGE